MKKNLLTITFIVNQIIAFAQSDLQKVAPASDGSIYSFGVFDGYIRFNNGTGFGDSTMYYTNYFIAKHAPNGSTIWAKEIKGNPAVYYGSAPGIGITVDSNNNPIVVGAFSELIDFENDTILTTNNYGMFTLKFNSNGNLIWAKKNSSNSVARGCDVIVDAQDNIYSAGEEDDNLALYKYSSAGTELWYRTIDDNTVHTMYDLSISPNGTIALTGHVFDAGTITTNTWTETVEDAMYVAFIDENGNHLGVNMIDNENFTYIENTEFDSQGNYYVAGRFNQTLDFGNGTAPTLTTFGPGFQHQFLAKYNQTNTDIWASTYQFSNIASQEGFSGGLSIQNDTLNYLMTGIDTVDIPNLPSINLATNGTLYAKIDMNGNGICQTVIDIMHFGEDLTTDAFGNSYIIGLTEQKDMLVVKIDNNCNIVWQDTIEAYLYNDPIGLDENKSEFLIYPNPISDQFTIEGTDDIATIEIWSVQGTFVQTVEMNGTKSKDVSFNAPSGVYNILVSYIDGKQKMQRLIKL